MSVRASVYSAAASTYLIAAIQMVATIITTRLMTPQDIGLYTIALSLVLISGCVADWGVNISIIQRHAEDTDSLRGCAWVAWAGGLGVGGLIAAGSGPIAALYGAPDLRPLLLILSARILLAPCGAVSSAIVARDLRFKPLAVMNIANATVQGVVSVVLVYFGARHFGLAIGCVCGFLAELLCSACYEPKHFLLRPLARGTKKLFHWGGLNTSITVVNALAVNASGLILGYFLGTRDTGYYARAMTLVSIVRRGVEGVINSVGIPAFVRANESGADMNTTFLGATTLLTGVVWPLFALVLVLSEPIVLLLFGKAWLGIVPIGQLLCVANMIAAMSALSGALLLGLKRSGVLLRREVLAQTLVLLLTLAGAQFSASAVAVAMIAASCAHMGITFQVLRGEIGLLWGQALRENAKSLGALAATSLGAGLGAWAVESWPALGRIALGGACGLGCWLLAVWALRHPLLSELTRLRARLTRGPQPAQ